MNYEDPRAVMHGPFMNWNHVDCFVARREELSFTADKSPTIMTGFMDLREKDRNMLFEKLGKGDKSKAPSKRKSENDDDEGETMKITMTTTIIMMTTTTTISMTTTTTTISMTTMARVRERRGL